MSFEGTKFLQKYSLDKRYSEYNFSHNPIMQIVFGRIYHFDASVWLFFMNTVPIPSIFIHKIPNTDQCAARKLRIR